MNILKRMAGGVALLFSIIACLAAAKDADSEIFFSDWSALETPLNAPRVFAEWRAPSGRGSICLLKTSDESEVYVLEYHATEQQDRHVLGKGLGSADVTWISTEAGEFAVVNHVIDNGRNELFVLRLSADKSLRIVFRTPEWLSPGQSVIGNCHWKVVGVDMRKGTLKLAASWDFANIAGESVSRGVSDRLYDIPLFYY